jgi:hypothetical protein
VSCRSRKPRRRCSSGGRACGDVGGAGRVRWRWGWLLCLDGGLVLIVMTVFDD